jgi:hypothetical protein
MVPDVYSMRNISLYTDMTHTLDTLRTKAFYTKSQEKKEKE